MKQAHQYVNQTSGKEDWMTPLNIVERARRTMGWIDLDPASSALANERVKAQEFFTWKDDGLRQKWLGRVWLNHPWNRWNNPRWINKLVEAYHATEIEQAVTIVPNSTSEEWFRPLLYFPMCVLHGRTAFVDPASGEPVTSPPKGCIVFYLGEYVARFANNFGSIGSIYLPWGKGMSAAGTHRIERWAWQNRGGVK